LDLLDPADGTQFPSGATVQVSALGVWTRSEVYGPVEFYDGNTIIGRSSPLAVARPSIPCLPSVHTIQWTNPPAGQHVLSARTELSLNLWATSPPVRITVAPPPPQTVVRIDATQPIAEEDSTPLDRLSLVGVFTISRTGPTNDSRPVFVEYAGTATSQQDYPSLPWLVTIPAGATATELRVMPLADGLPEGIETLVARISNCPPETDPPMGIPCYAFDIDPAHQSATVFLRDDGVTRASLTITNPKDGANFNVGETVLIDVTAVDLDGYISHVDFFDGVQRIGESEIVFIRAPDPGTPIFHSLHWQGAAPGSHVLTARAADTHGTTLSSRLVQITVGPTSNQPPRIAITRPLAGTDFPLNAAIEVVAEARDTDGFVRRAEFFADGRKIGEQSILFTQPPQLGQTQTFTFVWRFPPPGPHLLTARVTDDHGARGQSASVEIRVNPPDQLPVLTVIARDTFAVEPGTNVPPNTASFAVRRFGTTNEALVVNYSMHGTAQNGADYEMLSGLATIQAGQRSVIVTARPLPDNLVEGIETVILRLEEPPAGPAGAYRLGFPHRALALVSDRPWVRSPSGVRCSSLIGGVVHVCFDAETGYNFRVEASSDLRNWETVFNSLAIDGALHFVDDEMATTSHRFYRLTPEPVVEVNN
jgi:hypothetical protein